MRLPQRRRPLRRHRAILLAPRRLRRRRCGSPAMPLAPRRLRQHLHASRALGCLPLPPHLHASPALVHRHLLPLQPSIPATPLTAPRHLQQRLRCHGSQARRLAHRPLPPQPPCRGRTAWYPSPHPAARPAPPGRPAQLPPAQLRPAAAQFSSRVWTLCWPRLPAWSTSSASCPNLLPPQASRPATPLVPPAA